eukprot:m.52212 g.52212  ORF g.52212 m.52212 type:complete len:81 (+) comp34188_c0_seq18:1861-2103(+)
MHFLEAEKVVEWLEKGIVDQQTAGAIQKTVAMRGEIGKISKTIYEKESEVREVKETQERLRENIQALKHYCNETLPFVIC